MHNHNKIQQVKRKITLSRTEKHEQPPVVKVWRFRGSWLAPGVEIGGPAFCSSGLAVLS